MKKYYRLSPSEGEDIFKGMTCPEIGLHKMYDFMARQGSDISHFD